MCGFIGIISSGEIADSAREPSTYLLNILSHRGPDNASFYKTKCGQDSSLLFIHNRLSIIDLTEEANQPMTENESGNAIVFNGEIYNFREIKETYSHISWETQSDTEVILKLYNHLGSAFVEELNGIFAFAIYDRRRNKIVLCRDRFGVKPLYFTETDRGIVFASEIKAILQIRPGEINLQAVYDYLEFGSIAHNKETFFKGVYALEPAHMLEYDIATRQTRKFRYWDVPDDENQLLLSEQEVLNNTYDMLRDAARLNMVSDVEVAISLSSGMDSALILKLARERNSRLKAFTFGFEEQEYDEVSRIRQQGILDGVDLYPVYLKRSRMLSRLKEAIYYFEAPLGGVGTLSAYNMMKEVNRQGIKVMLAGEGSDETFGGYKYYYPAFFKDIENNLNLLKQELKAYSASHGQTVDPFSDEYYKLTELINKDVVLAPDGTGAFTSHASELLANSVNRKTSMWGRSFTTRLQQIMYKDLAVKKLPKLLFFQDRAAMANSVETRVPFLDHDLVSFLYCLPGTFKIRNGESKYLIKRILRDKFNYIDDKKIKHYVATPQREWLKDGQICKEILETVRNGKLVEQELIDYKRFEQDYLNYAESTELGNSFFVWKIINLEYLLGTKWI